MAYIIKRSLLYYIYLSPFIQKARLAIYYLLKFRTKANLYIMVQFVQKCAQLSTTKHHNKEHNTMPTRDLQKIRGT